MQILKGEQLRVDSGGKEQVTQLQAKFIRYTYNQAPFDSQYWDADTKPLEYWKILANHSNAKQIGYIFSIMPSEICDEHTASRLGWFNAARRSSILPEDLITCARLYDLYTMGIAGGDYIHEAFVALDEALVPAGTPQIRSAPSLINLTHEENIYPSMVDEEAPEELLFNHPDPLISQKPNTSISTIRMYPRWLGRETFLRLPIGPTQAQGSTGNESTSCRSRRYSSSSSSFSRLDDHACALPSAPRHHESLRLRNTLTDWRFSPSDLRHLPTLDILDLSCLDTDIHARSHHAPDLRAGPPRRLRVARALYPSVPGASVPRPSGLRDMRMGAGVGRRHARRGVSFVAPAHSPPTFPFPAYHVYRVTCAGSFPLAYLTSPPSSPTSTPTYHHHPCPHRRHQYPPHVEQASALGCSTSCPALSAAVAGAGGARVEETHSAARFAAPSSSRLFGAEVQRGVALGSRPYCCHLLRFSAESPAPTASTPPQASLYSSAAACAAAPFWRCADVW
ncbi:hypothetical protein C8J57DRAFT_1509206 [Mycena rebaudengoi]|nr:hypothetical protein C8J57DRAFT_1509206 [Mycena rebaudengoi]